MNERIIQILKGINEDIISYEGTNMMGDGLVDSFELIDIVSQLEEEFDIEIDGEYVIVENFANKDTIIALMKELLG